MISFNKLGNAYTPMKESQEWLTHAMAPTAVELENFVRVFVGGWDANGISRIFSIDLDKDNPLSVVSVNCVAALSIGEAGCFDENGVFPGHVFREGNTIWMHYTGFQLGAKVPHYNFGGLAFSNDGGVSFRRLFRMPLLDRSDEGLTVRAGASTLRSGSKYSTVYSAGSEWVTTGGKLRPCYDVYLIDSPKFDALGKAGKRIITSNSEVEHGLGRPQLIELNGRQHVFYTRRILGMKYFFGYAVKNNLGEFVRCDDTIDVAHGDDFDARMMYFPSVLKLKNGRSFMFYSGNDFGKGGLGVCEINV